MEELGNIEMRKKIDSRSCIGSQSHIYERRLFFSFITLIRPPKSHPRPRFIKLHEPSSYPWICRAQGLCPDASSLLS